MAASLSAHAEENEILGIMVISKFAGLCGAFTQMLNFQESTKMDNGDEFIMRFLSVESARLGLTPEQFGNQCKENVSKYIAYYKLLDES